MTVPTIPMKKKNKELRSELATELNFIKKIFSVLSLPNKGENEADLDYEITNESPRSEEKCVQTKRAASITELEQRLRKIKSDNPFNLKKKLEKKSLSSKLHKKIKKHERLSKNKEHVKEVKIKKEQVAVKNETVKAKPVFNTEGKLVFSKFDFANMGKKEKIHKAAKDPKKLLENLKQQEQKINELKEKDAMAQVKEIKEKTAWKNVLQKAEGQKVKDDATLLKKSIKRMDQKKKASKKQWETRIKGVEQKKEDRQKKRKENINKKKQEKKSKVVKAATKKGRVVI